MAIPDSSDSSRPDSMRSVLFVAFANSTLSPVVLPPVKTNSHLILKTPKTQCFLDFSGQFDHFRSLRGRHKTQVIESPPLVWSHLVHPGSFLVHPALTTDAKFHFMLIFGVFFDDFANGILVHPVRPSCGPRYPRYIFIKIANIFEDFSSKPMFFNVFNKNVLKIFDLQRVPVRPSKTRVRPCNIQVCFS